MENVCFLYLKTRSGLRDWKEAFLKGRGCDHFHLQWFSLPRKLLYLPACLRERLPHYVLCIDKRRHRRILNNAIIELLQITANCILHSHSSMPCLIPLDFGVLELIPLRSLLPFLSKMSAMKRISKCQYDIVRNMRAPATAKHGCTPHILWPRLLLMVFQCFHFKL